MAMSHLLSGTPIRFVSSEAVEYIGLLLLLPFLIAAELLSYNRHYEELDSGYYFLDVIILLLSFMYLARIKNPEQLKKISPGEFGKLMGLDRIPETKCFRGKLKEVIGQKKAQQWSTDLVQSWSSEQDNEFYYIDGHVQVYRGYQATLGKKHVARQKLCLPGIQQFWVNDKNGLPLFYITGEVNEKLIQMMSEQIIPKLLKDITPRYSEQELQMDADLPVMTVVFDREGYSPVFFKKLWDEHRIAVLTYKKNVKDKWDENDFSSYTIESDKTEEKMLLAEKEVELNGCKMREIRKLCKDHHQTTIITTNKKLSIDTLAVNMFSRWTQENYFKYMRKDYDFDRMMQYVVEAIDNDFIVSNPEYNNLTYKLKKVREKISRRQAKLFQLMEENINDKLANVPKQLKKQAREQEEVDILKKEEEDLLKMRNDIPTRIKIKDMPEHLKYNRLHIESKHFQNIVKMICYRAESSCANALYPFYNNADNDKRELVKSIINSHGDIICDDEKKTLTVRIYSLSCPRMNYALEQLCLLLNDTETKYPDTDYTLFYELAK
jgi:hypothetical protein